MLILGVADGATCSASLVADDHVLCHVVGAPDARVGFSRGGFAAWSVIDQALAMAGVRPAEVDSVALAGRYTPTFLRRNPILRRILTAPLSPWLDATVKLQAVLRHSGIGAFDADVGAEWLEEQIHPRGFRPRRTQTIEVHKALAEAAYRLQPADEALIVTMHPMGDGSALTVHVGRAGQLDRVFVQRGFEALHVHLHRVCDALGVAGAQALQYLGALSASGTSDARLERLLAEQLRADGPRLSRLGRSRADFTEIQARMDALSPADAAASVLTNLADAVEEIVRWYLQEHRIRHLSVAGSLFECPQLVARLADMPEVARLTVLPSPGEGLLAIGAAACEGGLAPRDQRWLLGQDVPGPQVAAVVSGAVGIIPARQGLVEALSRGDAVGRYRGRPGHDRLGLGERCVVVRGDSLEAIQATHQALRLPPHEQPRLLVRAHDKLVRWDRALVWGHTTRHGCGAVELDGPTWKRLRWRAPDARAVVQEVDAEDQPGLHRLMDALEVATGSGVLAAFPFSEGDGAPVADPAHAIEVMRRARLAAVQLGALVLERAP